MQGNELMVEEIEVSLTLGGSGEGRVQGRGTWSEHFLAIKNDVLE
jgi:hypothetical protein